MKKRLITTLLVLILGAYGAACDDTIEGVEEDTGEAVEEIEEQLDEAESP